jgi:Cytochrome P450
MAISSLLQWGIVALIAYLAYRYSFHWAGRRRTNLPPGPKPLPIVANAQDFPPAGVPEFQHWIKHKDLYGPISSVTVLGTTLVIIHDKKAAHDLLEQNANKTSGRPTMVFANKMCGYESIVLCQGYNSTFRHYRKLLHRELGTKVSAAQFCDIQEIEVNRQLVRALNEPGKWLEHFKT